MFEEHVDAGRHCYVAGWGLTRFIGPISRQPNIMREAGVDIFNHQSCYENATIYIDESVEFCAGNVDKNGAMENGNGPCFGN